MACQTTHSITNRVQGPGICCAALGSQTPVLGLRFGATDSRGKCFVCEIKASTAKKNIGKTVLVFKRGKSAGICPTSSTGCCALQGLAA